MAARVVALALALLGASLIWLGDGRLGSSDRIPESAASTRGGATRRLSTEATAGRQPNVTAAATLASTIGWDRPCSNKCYRRLGFTDDDCQCVNRIAWYRWQCTSRYGAPIIPQSCDSVTCGGCVYAPPPSLPPAPAPPVDAPTPAPIGQPLAPAPPPPPSPQAACATDWMDCTSSGCCANPGFRCYHKNEWYAQCRDWCRKGIHYEEPRRFWQPWSCEIAERPATPAPAPPTPEAPAPVPPAPAPPVPAPEYKPALTQLLKPSTAPTFTFYMYRVQNDQDYPPENQNTANLAGAMWYLHNEIVNNLGARRFRKTRIQRFLVRTKTTQALADAGMQFGVRYAFDAGQCTGPFNCTKQWQKYGYFVGCNYVDRFPTQQWAGKVFYPNATWYSLPGTCNSRRYNQHDEACSASEPGGACDDPTGQGNCTYGYRHAGEISIDDLEGIADFAQFVQKGGWEYNNHTDRGVHLTFWDDKYNLTAGQRRLAVAQRLFAEKYPDLPTDADLPAPPCDFAYSSFYAGDIPESLEAHF